MARTLKLVLPAVLLATLAGAALAQAPSPEEQAAAQAAWEKAAAPGEHHAFLAKLAGRWQVTGKMWMAPDQEPMPSESTAEARMIMGGRFLLEESKGTIMGMPFEGMMISGYDNTTGKATAVWYDNMGTVTTILTGDCGAPGSPLELHGTMVDPYTKGELPMRSVTTYLGPDERLFEYFSSLAAGLPEMKILELRYKRIP